MESCVVKRSRPDHLWPGCLAGGVVQSGALKKIDRSDLCQQQWREQAGATSAAPSGSAPLVLVYCALFAWKRRRERRQSARDKALPCLTTLSNQQRVLRTGAAEGPRAAGIRTKRETENRDTSSYRR